MVLWLLMSVVMSKLCSSVHCTINIEVSYHYHHAILYHYRAIVRRELNLQSYTKLAIMMPDYHMMFTLDCYPGIAISTCGTGMKVTLIQGDDTA